MNNYFSVFDVPVSFDLDSANLEQRYFAVQRICHPDRLVGKPTAERQQAILRSMQANEAYETLKTPLLRARHMLALQGIYVGAEKDTVKPAPALLMEIIELREALEEALSADKVKILHDQNQQSINAQIHSLSQAFAKSDTQTATKGTLRLGYLLKIAEELRLKAIA